MLNLNPEPQRFEESIDLCSDAIDLSEDYGGRRGGGWLRASERVSERASVRACERAVRACVERASRMKLWSPGTNRTRR